MYHQHHHHAPPYPYAPSTPAYGRATAVPPHAPPLVPPVHVHQQQQHTNQTQAPPPMPLPAHGMTHQPYYPASSPPVPSSTSSLYPSQQHLSPAAPPPYNNNASLQKNAARGFVAHDPRDPIHLTFTPKPPSPAIKHNDAAAYASPADAYTDNDHPDTQHRLDQLNEWNQVVSWMDHEFWEQREQLYQDKLVMLQDELASLQTDTHETFNVLVGDLDMGRSKTIHDAECFLKYQLEWMDQVYQEEVRLIEEEYNTERRHLHDTLMAVIEDRKKQIKEERDDGFDLKDLFKEAYARVTNKRSLRRRAAEASRNETRKRQKNQNTDGHAAIKEEEELEDEFMLMKKMADALLNIPQSAKRNPRR
ncbi:Sds3-like-domain-containing protein [Gongronella butleri]|nr:Sds3-like-domain-containing protein [Gongronella butleri]